MKRLKTLVVALFACIAMQAANEVAVTVVYNGTTATVSIPASLSSYVSCPSGTSSHVRLVQASTVGDNTSGEITYILSGSSDDGEFFMEGDYKATVRLNGLTLTNPDSTAIHLKDGKRMKVNLPEGTTNTLTNGATDTESKGCLHCKGHTEFTGKGTLNIVSNFAHAIYSKEYVSIKNCTINITKAKKDGIHCQEYFLMEKGTVNISDVEDDGIQVELKGDSSTGEKKNHEDEDTGNFYMTGGTLSMNNVGSKNIKAEGKISFSGGTQNFDKTNIKEYATGISTIATDGLTIEAIYDLNGRQLTNGATLPKGVYIVRKGNKTSKVFL